jgi:hypothetical protein
VLDKRPLKRMLAVKTLDGRDPGTFDVGEWYQTRVHRLTVDEYGARATFAFATSFFGTGQPAVLAQHVQETLHRMSIESSPFAVQHQVHVRRLVAPVGPT